jgi:hypothetical protein
MPEQRPTPFSATHHALLFAWISRALFQRVDEETAEIAIRKAVRRYGEQRGKRMALRAEADGHALSMAAYRAYGEWVVEPDEMASRSVEQFGDVTTHVHRCSWYTAWTENGLSRYGRYYCLEIDRALVRGFNSALCLEVNRTQPGEGDYCEFVYRDVGEAIPDPAATMPWEYHAGHMYKTMGEVLAEELGSMGSVVIGQAMDWFTERYGVQAVRQITAYQDVDFCVPLG